ncbi:class I SAM-dependent RNA methyltransferase [Candidatus Saccharibacteria bacterium]|nr:class I SAM-dependent RNA methyltransferase [Candidatus Saccharibacteria bacterium]
MNDEQTETIVLQKVINGGQTLGELADGKKVFVWGGLPGETVIIRILKNKKTWAEGIVEEVIEASEHRVEAKDPQSYLSTSPWQIFEYDYENELKKDLIKEQFLQNDITLEVNEFSAPEEPYYYRNKIEFSFWWNKETDQLDLAFYKRGTHSRQAVDGTSLAKPCISEAAEKIRDYLRANKYQARDLKTLILRCDQEDTVIAQLYVKEKEFKIKVEHTEFGVAGFSVHFSNPKSPASVITETLLVSGAQSLSDTILGARYSYAVDGFFQVSIPEYEQALEVIDQHIDHEKPLIDMYSGVGSIGLSLADEGQKLTLVEVDERCVIEARANAAMIKPDTEVVLASSETALEHIASDATVILDPPRAGLHEKVVAELISKKPQTIVYLSCNPATQARDVALLQDTYEISYVHGFNFFPRTPHIENLVVLTAK